MSVVKDGGPAFPSKFLDSHGMPSALINGMSLRDYFAAKALQGFAFGFCTAMADEIMKGDALASKTMATFAYRAADAMLAEREKNGTA